MSTKIYNGHKFKSYMDLLELNERLLELRKTYRKEIKAYTKKLFMNLVYFYEDLYSVDKSLYHTKMKQFGDFSEIGDSDKYLQVIAANVALNLTDKVEKAMQEPEYSPVFDISANLQIFPLRDKILFTFYGSHSLEQILETEPDIEEYHYQNQCDMPEDISEDEWEQRRIDWNMAIPSGIPAKNGFGVELVVSADIPLGLSEWFEDNDYEKHKRTLESRTSSIAECCYKNEETLMGRECNYTGSEYQIWLEKHKSMIMETLSKAGDPVAMLYKQYSYCS